MVKIKVTLTLIMREPSRMCLAWRCSQFEHDRLTDLQLCRAIHPFFLPAMIENVTQLLPSGMGLADRVKINRLYPRPAGH